MEALVDFLKLISDETRLRIMALLYHQQLCVCELCGVMDVSQPNVSKHLAKMRDTGFVRDEKRGQYVFYSLNIENGVFKDILKRILADSDNLPILTEDLKKAKDALKYLELCKRGEK